MKLWYKILLENNPRSELIHLRYGVSNDNDNDIYNQSLSTDTQTFISDRKTYYSSLGVPQSFVNGNSLPLTKDWGTPKLE